MFVKSKFHHRLLHIKSSVFSFVFWLPTSLLARFILILLTCSILSVFYINLHVPAKSSPELASLLPESLPGDKTVTKLESLVMYAVKEENPPVISKAHLPLLQNPSFSKFSGEGPLFFRRKQGRLSRHVLRILSSPEVKTKGFSSKVENLFPESHLSLLQKPRFSKLSYEKAVFFRRKQGHLSPPEAKEKGFSSKVKNFIQKSKCRSRFFMTWISSVESLLGDRELMAIQSVFKSHPKACLIIVSNSLDSEKGGVVLKPFLDKGFKLIAIDPDFDYIFKHTPAELWFNRLKEGNVNPGEVSLGQNISNLLRLALLYKYGGIYIDTDIIVLKSFSKLRNVIGAQSIHPETKNWSRLNNAVLVFDKQHPLLYKFIQEFALTFDGSKWGHNGPYLVSRVVERVKYRPGFNFTVLPPSAFYPVDWSGIQALFRGPKDGVHSIWLNKKLDQIRRRSYAVHLWNRQSRKVRVQEGSIVHHIVSVCCIFCNSSLSSL